MAITNLFVLYPSGGGRGRDGVSGVSHRRCHLAADQLILQLYPGTVYSIGTLGVFHRCGHLAAYQLSLQLYPGTVFRRYTMST